QADVAAEVERLPAPVAGAVARVCIRRGEGGLVESEDLIAARAQRGDPQEPDRDEETPRAHASSRERATVSSICEAVPQVILRRMVHLAPLGFGGVPAVRSRCRRDLGELDGAAPAVSCRYFSGSGPLPRKEIPQTEDQRGDLQTSTRHEGAPPMADGVAKRLARFYAEVG